MIAKGLEADERVVTTGFARLTAGAEVTVDQRRGGAVARRAAGPAAAARRRGASDSSAQKPLRAPSPSAQQ